MSANYWVIGRVYECLSNPDPNAVNQTISEVTGDHLVDKNYRDVKLLSMYGNFSLNYVPNGVLRFFPNLIAIRMWRADIDTLHGHEFKDIPQLEWLSFHSSTLTTISGKLFEMSPNMSFVNFQNNMIQRVGYYLFTPLDISKLIRIDFAINSCISQTASNPTQVLSIIDNLRERCPYDAELITTEATTTISSTTEEATCGDGDIDERVCELEMEMKWVKEELRRLKEGQCG